MGKYPERQKPADLEMKDSGGTADLEFPIDPGFVSQPPRMDRQVMLRRLAETITWRSSRADERERRLSSRVTSNSFSKPIDAEIHDVLLSMAPLSSAKKEASLPDCSTQLSSICRTGAEWRRIHPGVDRTFELLEVYRKWFAEPLSKADALRAPKCTVEFSLRYLNPLRSVSSR